MPLFWASYLYGKCWLPVVYCPRTVLSTAGSAFPHWLIRWRLSASLCPPCFVAPRLCRQASNNYTCKYYCVGVIGLLTVDLAPLTANSTGTLRPCLSCTLLHYHAGGPPSAFQGVLVLQYRFPQVSWVRAAGAAVLLAALEDTNNVKAR